MAAKKQNKVTERLGLEPMSRKPTLKEYAERRATLVRKIESGKLKGILLQRAKEYVASIDYRVKKKRGEPINPKASLTRRAKASIAKMKAQLDAGQMQLPNFLSQMNLVRIEEMVADRIVKSLLAEMRANLSKKVS